MFNSNNIFPEHSVSIPATILFLISVPMSLFFLLATDKPFLSMIIAPGIVSIFILYTKPFIPFLLILLLVPLSTIRELSDSNSSLTISKIFGILLIVVVACKFSFSNKQLHYLANQKILLLLLLLLFSSIISTILSPWPLNSLNDIRSLIQSYAFALLTLYFANNRKRINIIGLVLIAGASISATIAIVADVLDIRSMQNTLSSGDEQTNQAMGAANDTNFFAAMLLCSIPYILKNFFAANRPKKKLFWIGIFILNSMGILITYSRSVTLIFFLTLMLCFLFFRHRLSKTIAIQLVLIILVGGTLILNSSIGTTILQRLSTLKNISQDQSLSRRKTYIPVAIDAFKIRPLIGWGPGNFRFLYSKSKYPIAFEKEREGYYRYAHNTVLEVIVGFGLSGLILCFLVLFLAILYFWKQIRTNTKNELYDKDFAASMTVSLLSMLLSLFVLSDLQHKYLWLHIGLGMACFKIHTSEKTLLSNTKVLPV